jgi:hypothetical protein
MKTKHSVFYPLAGALLLLSGSAPAQNLFVANSGSGSIDEVTPDGTSFVFATGLNPSALSFNNAGDLSVISDGNIYQFAPDGTKSTFASGALASASGGYSSLASDNAGDLFVGDGIRRQITKITPDGAQSVFASGLTPTALAFAQMPANAEMVYVGNPALPFVDYAQPDGVPPMVIMGEYSPAGPLPDTVQPLPKGDAQDVKFYGQNYDFTLYALRHVSDGPNANEQTFTVVAAEHFSGYNAAPGIITLALSNFRVKDGDFLAFSGIGPWYPQQPNDALNTDATYEDAVQPDPVNDNDTATPPVMGETFSVGINRDTAATYGYIADNFGNQGRTYAIGVDVKRELQDRHDRHP